jgi:hypothetical protein
VVSLNLHRRYLTTSQWAMLGARIKVEFEAEARMLAGVHPPANLPEGPTGESREKAAEVVNVSPCLVESVSKVQKDGTRPARSSERHAWDWRAAIRRERLRPGPNTIRRAVR